MPLKESRLGGAAVGRRAGFKHEGSQQIVGEQEGANDFPGHGWGFGIHKLHPHGGFDVLEGQLHAPPGMVDTGKSDRS